MLLTSSLLLNPALSCSYAGSRAEGPDLLSGKAFRLARKQREGGLDTKTGYVDGVLRPSRLRTHFEDDNRA